MHHQNEVMSAAAIQLGETEVKIEHCAKIVHEVIRALNDAHNEHTIPWEVAGPSTLDGVRKTLENPGRTGEQSHQAWMEFKLRDGWVYGPTKDAAKKTHPCMVPYPALPAIQKAKDGIFLAIVRSYFGL